MGSIEVNIRSTSYNVLLSIGYFVQLAIWLMVMKHAFNRIFCTVGHMGNGNETCLIYTRSFFASPPLPHMACTKYPIRSNALWEVLHIFS